MDSDVLPRLTQSVGRFDSARETIDPGEILPGRYPGDAQAIPDRSSLLAPPPTTPTPTADDNPAHLSQN